MTKTLLIALGVVLTLPMSAKSAIIGGWGVAAITSTASNCPSFCTSDNGGQFARDSESAEEGSFAFASENTFGQTQSLAELTGIGDLPLLKAEASSDAGRGAFATAFAAQAYTYGGTTATTLTLDFDLTGTVGNNDNNAYKSNIISSNVAVVKTSGGDFFSDFGTLVFEVLSGEERVGYESMFISLSNSDTFASIDIDLNPGDDYFVIADLRANARNGFADAFSTLAAQYVTVDPNDPDIRTALTTEQLGSLGISAITAPSIPVSVPEPTTLLLFGTSLLGFMATHRRRRIRH